MRTHVSRTKIRNVSAGTARQLIGSLVRILKEDDRRHFGGRRVLGLDFLNIESAESIPDQFYSLLAKFSWLRSLNLSNFPGSANDIAQIVQGWGKLKELHLSGSVISQAAINKLPLSLKTLSIGLTGHVTFPFCSKVSDLAILGEKVLVLSGELASSLSGLRRLTILPVGEYEHTTAFYDEFWANHTLEEMDLRTVPNQHHLMRWLGNIVNLRKLTLSDLPLDVTAEELSRFTGLRSLSIIHFSKFEKISLFKNIPNLRRLSLSTNSLNPCFHEEIRELRRAMPDCAIRYHW